MDYQNLPAELRNTVARMAGGEASVEDYSASYYERMFPECPEVESHNYQRSALIRRQHERTRTADLSKITSIEESLTPEE